VGFGLETCNDLQISGHRFAVLLDNANRSNPTRNQAVGCSGKITKRHKGVSLFCGRFWTKFERVSLTTRDAPPQQRNATTPIRSAKKAWE
jgi:hypothetical protein